MAARLSQQRGVREGAIGLFASDIDFGYAAFSDDQHVFDALNLDLTSTGFAGLGDILTATLEDVSIGRNAGRRTHDERLAAIDFQQSFWRGWLHTFDTWWHGQSYSHRSHSAGVSRCGPG